jgi:hypothetical protein
MLFNIYINKSDQGMETGDEWDKWNPIKNTSTIKQFFMQMIKYS